MKLTRHSWMKLHWPRMRIETFWQYNDYERSYYKFAARWRLTNRVAMR